jgi:O-antigen ligase
MSMGEFLLVAMWLWSGFSFKISARFFKLGGYVKGIYHLFGYLAQLAYHNIIDKFTLFFRNKPAVILTSIFLLHILGLAYTSDMEYAMKDLRVKLPLLFFPVIISTMESFRYKRFKILMLFYVAAVLAGSMISFSIILKGQFTDIRDISPYVGSIRFGLNVSLAFFTLVYFVLYDKEFKYWQKLLFSLIGIWFVIFLILMESVTSLSIILTIVLGYLVYQSLKTKYFALKIAIILVVIALPTALFFYIRSEVIRAVTPPDIDNVTLDRKTIQGNIYFHDTIVRGLEDGRYVGLYLCEKELQEAWGQRSKLDYYAKTSAGHELKESLIRYMTSKDLRKDREGIAALSDWDIQMIENGVANYNYVKNPGLRARMLKIIMGYEVYLKTGDPSGSSVMQRIEYSKGSINLIKENFWFGVGTGDIENALIEQYKEMKSELKSEYMFHAHNQYFAIFITFGIFGLLWFLFALVYPPLAIGRFSDYFFVTFFVIMLLSMLSDDTLETQAGVTLFAFFYSFFLFGKKKENA